MDLVVDTYPVFNDISWSSKMANGEAMKTDLIKAMSYRTGKIVLAGLWVNVLYDSKMNRRGLSLVCLLINLFYLYIYLFLGRGPAFLLFMYSLVFLSNVTFFPLDCPLFLLHSLCVTYSSIFLSYVFFLSFFFFLFIFFSHFSLSMFSLFLLSFYPEP